MMSKSTMHTKIIGELLTAEEINKKQSSMDEQMNYWANKKGNPVKFQKPYRRTGTLLDRVVTEGIVTYSPDGLKITYCNMADVIDFGKEIHIRFAYGRNYFEGKYLKKHRYEFSGQNSLCITLPEMQNIFQLYCFYLKSTVY